MRNNIAGMRESDVERGSLDIARRDREETHRGEKNGFKAVKALYGSSLYIRGECPP